jgi:hypothetical protein
MSKSSHWAWQMARGGVVRARQDTSGGAVKGDEEWSYAVSKLHRLQELVFRISIARDREDIGVTGTVVSEQVKRLIGEILVDYDPQARIHNLIEVTAPFRSAENDDFVVEMKGKLTLDSAPSPTRSTSVERYPAFSNIEKPVVGCIFRFEVDLLAAPGDHEGIKFDLPPGWEMAAVDVDVHSAQLRIDGRFNRRKIALFDDGRSMPARFEGEVIGVAESGTVEVLISFTCEGRHVGTRYASFECEPAAGVAPRPSETGPADYLDVAFEEKRPDLMVKIYNAGRASSWIWMVHAPDSVDMGDDQRHGIIDLPDTEAFAANLLRQCPSMKAPQHASRLRGIGEEIWGCAPASFRSLYRDMRQTFGANFTIQLVTGEPHVPWEMMFPDGVHNPDHLFMTHPICRWSSTFEAKMRPALKRGAIASFVPDYGIGKTLPAAIAEGEWLVATLGATPMDATWSVFTKFWTTDLPEEHVAILHFAGHGDNQPDPRIRMKDGYVSRDDVNGSVMLGSRDGTFVVLNACEVGSNEVRLGLVAGWTEKLIKHSFGGVLAPLWKVEDDCASQVVRTYLQKFCRGVPMGMAMLQARTAQRQESATPFAYICHGDVTARML